MYLSRLAATKEYAYNKALWEAGFRVPVAVDHNRHCILMEFIEAYPLYQMKRLRKPERVGFLFRAGEFIFGGYLFLQGFHFYGGCGDRGGSSGVVFF